VRDASLWESEGVSRASFVLLEPHVEGVQRGSPPQADAECLGVSPNSPIPPRMGARGLKEGFETASSWCLLLSQAQAAWYNGPALRFQMRIAANILTTLRFILAPIVMWLILADERAAALSVYAVAIVTDILDGYLARRSKIMPSYGPTFDALADCSLFYLPIIALAITGRGFWLLVGATISVAYLVPVLVIIRKKKGGLTIPRLDTGLLATSVHMTIIAHIVGWEYAQFLVLPLFLVALMYGRRYLTFARNG